MPEQIGLYLHIPFCKSKCSYCDFFSGAAKEADYDEYTEKLKQAVAVWGDAAPEKVKSVYFGGGTPSVLGTERLCDILDTVKASFDITENAEITLEANPESGRLLDFAKLKSAGFDRLSVGLQSANNKELKTLGRIHTLDDAACTVKLAQESGIDNISLDLMMGIPFQTKESLKNSIDFCAECGVKHISSYILKLEKGTKLYSIKEQLALPDEDEQAELYLFAVEYLAKLGYEQYEISNFAFKGYESRHNTLYWQCGEYIGLGPSAHSFYHGRRFHFERNLQSFYDNITVGDGEGGSEEEYIMLSLRLKTGLVYDDYLKRFNKPLSPAVLSKIQSFARMGFMDADDKHACFTPKGFLVSNTLIVQLLDLI